MRPDRVDARLRSAVRQLRGALSSLARARDFIPRCDADARLGLLPRRIRDIAAEIDAVNELLNQGATDEVKTEAGV